MRPGTSIHTDKRCASGLTIQFTDREYVFDIHGGVVRRPGHATEQPTMSGNAAVVLPQALTQDLLESTTEALIIYRIPEEGVAAGEPNIRACVKLKDHNSTLAPHLAEILSGLLGRHHERQADRQSASGQPQPDPTA